MTVESPGLTHLLDLVEPTGELDLSRLADEIAAGPVEVGVLTDEELHWFGPDPDAAPDPRVDAPRLGRLAPDQQQVALETALRLLQGRGELVLEPDRPGEVLRLGPRAVAVALRAEADARCTAILRRGGEEQQAFLFRLPGVGFLTETSGEDGLHHLVLRSADDQVRWLAALAGPSEGATGPVQRAATGEELDPPLASLRRAATTELSCVLGTRLPDGHRHVRELQLLTGDGGTWVVRHHADAAGATEVVLQPLGGEDVAPLLAAFLTTLRAPGDVPIAPPPDGHAS